MIKFSAFDREFNPAGKLIYVPMYDKDAPKKMARYDALTIAKMGVTDPHLEIGLSLVDDMVVYHFHDSNEADYILQIIKAKKLKVMAVRVPDGMDVYLIQPDLTATFMNVLALGAHVDVYTASSKEFMITPFRHPSNVSAYLEETDIVYYGGIGNVPKWFLPIHKRSKPSLSSHIKFPLEDRYRDAAFIKHFYLVNKLKLSEDEKEELADIISTYICESPLGAASIKKITKRTVAKIPENEFFDERTGKFFHNKLSEIIMEQCHVKKDIKSNDLYHYNEHRKVYENNPEYLKSMMTRMVPSLKDTQKTEVLKYMTSYLEMEKVKFNHDPLSIVLKNGILDLATMDFVPHSPDYLETIALNVEYDSTAESRVADEFFKTITMGDKDVETLLYEVIGYSFLKTAELAKSFILTGGGRNGKSTFQDLINAIVGDENATAIDLKSLSNNFRISNLHGKLVSLAGDISSAPMSDTDTYKSLVSGDKMLLEKKYHQAFEDKIFATLIFSCNKLPRSPDNTYGFLRRFVIVPFHADLAGVSDVDGMKFKRELLGENSKRYVARRAIEAIRRVMDTTKNFIEPQVCKDMLNDYRVGNSSILMFAYETYPNPKKLVGMKLDGVYSHYKIWCETNSYKPFALSRFREEIMSEFKLDIMPSASGEMQFVAKV